jgi:L-aminopeptidase/D-esterase-like protein
MLVPWPAGAQPPSNLTLTAVDGLKVGHVTLAGRPTGCTVILTDGMAIGGVAQMGGAPGTRETDLLDPVNMVDKVDAIVLAGGSAYGLDAATGVMRWLEEHDRGWDVKIAKVPIVPAAILFDLAVGGNPAIRPDAQCGFDAAEQATSDPVTEGSVGAGAGATVGKLGGFDRAMRGGLGSFAIHMPNGLVVAAMVAVNAVGDIIDPDTGTLVAGVRGPDGKTLADARQLLRSGAFPQPQAGANTTIGVVATNAKLTKAELSRIAIMANAAFARTIYPAHTLADGDTVFSLATGHWDGRAEVTLIGALAADAMARAIIRGVQQATGLTGIPAARDLEPAQ